MLDEAQLKQDWEAVIALADQTGRSLEQVHIFALAHILRRPIIVYGVRVVKNYRGENLGFANFEGDSLLPLMNAHVRVEQQLHSSCNAHCMRVCGH